MLIRIGAGIGLAFLVGCGPNKDASDETTGTDGTTGTAGTTETTGTTGATETTGTTETTETTETIGTSGTSGTADTSTGEPTTGEPAVCSCVDDRVDLDAYTCELGPCGSVAVNCDVEEGIDEPGCEGIGGVFTVDEEALDCSLDRLIAGEEGWVGYQIESNGPGGAGGFALVLADRQALVRSWEYYDLGGSHTAAGVVALKDAAYFEGCKAMAALDQRYVCFTQWSAASPPPDCQMAESFRVF